MTTKYRIYWTDAQGLPHAHDCTELSEALAVTKEQRDAGMRFVTMASENGQSVGQPGVDAVANGKLPSGDDYDWSKAGRAGKPRRGDRVIATKDGH